jgi:hypothetical protein
MLEYIRQQRPDTKWVVHLLTNVTFYVNKINNHPIGGGVLLPAYVSNNPGLNNLTGGSNGVVPALLPSNTQDFGSVTSVTLEQTERLNTSS